MKLRKVFFAIFFMGLGGVTTAAADHAAEKSLRALVQCTHDMVSEMYQQVTGHQPPGADHHHNGEGFPDE